MDLKFINNGVYMRPEDPVYWKPRYNYGILKVGDGIDSQLDVFDQDSTLLTDVG